ncbi:MAG: chorismate synthase [Nitrospinota bacterium]
MAGNTIGQAFRVTTFGESHGVGLGVIVDGCPAGLPLKEEDFALDMARRRPGQSAATTSRQEADQVQILSGVYEGRTTGTPIAFVVYNEDPDPKAYEALKDLFRPGHADFTYWAKYGHRDHRGGGRSSGRETLARVTAGVIAKKILAEIGVRVVGHTVRVGDVVAETFDEAVIETNAIRCADPEAATRMLELIEAVRAEGDSIGGVVAVEATGVPPGLGEPVFDKLDADLAKAFMSIPTIKGLEIGSGFASATMRGSESNDPFIQTPDGVRTATNRAGGVLGGISTGMPIVCRLAVKPPSSVARQQRTLTVDGEETTLSVKGRHDPCVCPRVVPVAEAMMAIVLADHWLRQRLARLRPAEA